MSTEEHSAEHDIDLPRLTTALADAVGGLAGPLTVGLVAGGRSNPTYELTDGERRWILRRPPHGAVLESAHDMRREYRVLTALADTAVPVPRTVLVDDGDVLGVPFYVMDRLDGVTLRGPQDTAALTEEQRAALSNVLVDTLVSLHEIDPGAVGLQGWGRPDGYLERQLRRWRRQWEQVRTREAPEVDELVARLEASLPTESATAIVHGDYKIDNVMVSTEDPSRIIGVLDWEMSTLGDPLADLGLLVSFWDEPGGLHNPITAGATALPGFLSSDQVIHRYAEARGLPIDSVDWYVVLAEFKVAVVLEQIHARYLSGDTRGDWFSDIGDMVVPLLRRGLDRARASVWPGLNGKKAR